MGRGRSGNSSPPYYWKIIKTETETKEEMEGSIGQGRWPEEELSLKKIFWGGFEA